MLRRLIIAALITLPHLVTGATDKELSNANAKDWLRESRKIEYKEYSEIKRFYGLRVLLLGSAKEIGLSDSELTDFLILKFRNTFTGYSIASTAPLAEAQRDWNAFVKTRKEWASLSICVWTVGSDYPVAYHIELKIEQIGGSQTFETARLGYASAESLKSNRVIKDSISDLMEEAASVLFLVQGSQEK